MSQPAGSEPTIKAFDGAGRPIEIPVSEWRTKVLPDQIRRAWADADTLAAVITQAIRDDLAADVIDAAHRLVQLEHDDERGGVLLGVCLLETKQLDAAQQVLEATLTANPASASAMVNLAKIAHARGDAAGERALIDRAVAADPNYSVSLNYQAGLRQEADGPSGRLTAYQEAAQRPGAWYPQLQLGRAALADDDVHGAVQWFAQALDRAPDQPDALMQATGDLGNAGHLQEMLALGLPRYRPAVHGLPAGMNLLEALIQLQRVDDAVELVHRLYLLDRPDLRTRLAPFADRLDTLRAARVSGPVRADDGRLQVQVLTSSRPPWWRWLAEPTWLLPAGGEPYVVFLQLSVTAHPDEQEGTQRTEWRGRIARGTAWFLADLVRFAGGSSAMLLPVVVGGGPVLSSAADDTSTIPTLLQAGGVTPRVVVTGSLAGDAESPVVDLQVRAAPDWTVAASLQGVPMSQVWPAASSLLAPFGVLPPPRPLPLPAPDMTARVISGYDTLSTFMLVARGISSPDSLWGERASLDFLLDTAEHSPADLTTLQYLASLVAMTAYGSPIPSEYTRRTEELLQGRAIADVTRRLAPLAQSLAGRPPVDRDARSDADYTAWLNRLTPPWWD